MDQRVYGMLSLSTKAGKVVSGDDVCERTIKDGKAKLVILAHDLSSGLKKKYTDLCSLNNVSLKFFGTKESIGKAMGKVPRGTVVILDESFKEGILSHLDRSKDISGGEAFGES